MSKPSHSLTAFVLAGGKSSRMGQDKAFLQLGGRALISYALDLARSVTSEVRIVGESGKYSAFGMVVPDVYTERGPLGGIHAALLSSSTDLNLVLGVDLPFITPAFLRYLISVAESCDAMVTVPSSGGHLQTLCAVYRREFCEIAGRALAEGNNKIGALFVDTPVRVIGEDEMARDGFSASMFRNLNTPEDWESGKQDFEFGRTHL